NPPQSTNKHHDPITNLRKFIPKTPIHQLPQLINLVKPQITFIPPPPQPPQFLQLFTSQLIPFHQTSLLTPPLTPLPQIQPPYHLTPQQ
ncbi:sugar transferase, partial [Staphylococcus aureus]|uniref:sugar transferase n=1 Tax=Staphylococcus aureus TaxID=1280 RepID=UPI00164298F2